MAVGVGLESLAAKFSVLLPHLDERQKRLYLGSEARSLGYGGITAVARAAGVSRQTVAGGVDELESGAAPLGRVRRAGGGRKRVGEVDAGLLPALLALVEPDVRGDPMSPLRWTTRSTRNLAAELFRQGHVVSADTVAGLLREEGFSLQGNVKTLEGSQNPDRDQQFRYINDQVKEHQAAGEPVVSVDTKKKELVGQYKNGGREWAPEGKPVEVNTHDFPDKELGKAVPYGVYDVTANTGWVNVGTDHDTAAFAVESLRRWWNQAGRETYPDARRLLITADAGGSNGYRTRAWKTELAAFAVQTGLTITVCHFPPGTSKWNTIEHRLFSHITMNWRGRPLSSHEVILNTIAATTTRTGLRVHAELDNGQYATGITISDQEMEALPITSHDWHGNWNYTLRPEPPAPTPPARPATTRGDHTHWAHPALTGMSRTDWQVLTTQLTTPYQERRDAELHIRRGRPRRKPSGGAPPALTLSDKTLATVLRLRFRVPQHVLADLFGVAVRTISLAQQQILPLLAQHPTTITPTQTRLTTLNDLTTYATEQGITLTPDTNPAR
jgi:DDE family transposase/DDE superfamily endonuclease